MTITTTPADETFAGFDDLPDSACVSAPVVAKLYDVSEATIWRWARCRTIPAPIKRGGVTRWRVADLREHIRAAA